MDLQIPWWVLAVLFAVTEIWVFHIQVGREAQSISISEVPLILALFYALPQDLLVARVVGSALVMLLHRRQTLLKSGVNAALMFADTTVALVVFRVIGGGSTADGGREWVGGVAACAAAMAVDLVVLSLIIRWYDGKPPLSGVRSLVSGVGIAAASGVLGLMPLLTLRLGALAAVPLVASGAMLMFGYRAYASLADRHTSLERLFRFSRELSVAPASDDVLPSVLHQARELLRGETAEVMRFGDGRHLGLPVRRRAGASSSSRPRPPGPPACCAPCWTAARRCWCAPPTAPAAAYLLSRNAERGRHRPAALRRPDRRCARRARPDGRGARLLGQRRAAAADRRQPRLGGPAQRDAHRAAAPRRDARHPHRAAEPVADHRRGGRGTRRRAAPPRPGGRHDHRPERLQGRQRHPRPPHRRRPAAPGGRPVRRRLPRRASRSPGSVATSSPSWCTPGPRSRRRRWPTSCSARSSEHFTVGQERLHLSGSVGIALAPEHGRNVSDLLKRADIAMYAAKNGADSRVALPRRTST